jgi:hypothetical protein
MSLAPTEDVGRGPGEQRPDQNADQRVAKLTSGVSSAAGTLISVTSDTILTFLTALNP